MQDMGNGIMRAETLLEALCIAEDRQGGTIHQYSADRLRWVCERAPSPTRNTEGLYVLQYTRDDGQTRDLGFIGGPSIATIRKHYPLDVLDPTMRILWDIRTNSRPWTDTYTPAEHARALDRLAADVETA